MSSFCRKPIHVAHRVCTAPRASNYKIMLKAHLVMKIILILFRKNYCQMIFYSFTVEPKFFLHSFKEDVTSGLPIFRRMVRTRLEFFFRNNLNVFNIA